MPTDALLGMVQMQFPSQIMDWMKVTARNPVSNLYQKFDFSRIAVAGHSHGGSLAAYAYANGEGT